MAILATQRPTMPGVYIGRIFRPNPIETEGFVRQPCAVGKGSRLQARANRPIRRSYLTDVQLTFTASAPYIAPLLHAALPDQTLAVIFRSDGSILPDSKWDFVETVPLSGVYDAVLIRSDAYEAVETYSIDYQSTSTTILDDISTITPQLRRVLFVGDTENQTRYIEGVDFRIPISITPAAPRATGSVSNFETYGFSPPVPGIANVGSATAAITAGTYTHDYNRIYDITVDAVGASIDVSVRISLGSGGTNVLAPSPIHSAIASTITMSFTPGGVSTDSFVDPQTGDSITVEIDDTAADITSGDTFTFAGLGPALVEVSSAHLNTNQYGVIGTPTPSGGNTGTGSISVRFDADYTGPYNRSYQFEVTAVAGVTPNRTATILWVGFGDSPVTEGTINLNEATSNNENVLIESGIRLDFDFGGVHFAVTDTYHMAAIAARRDIESKDSRTTNLIVGAVGAGVISGQYETNTFEGRFGLFSVGTDGLLQLPGGTDVFFRNVGTLLAENRHTPSDEWTLSTTNEEVIDWSLTTRATETVPTSDIRTDVLGLITGVVGARYVILSSVPDTVLYVRDTVTGGLLSFSTITGQPFIYFLVPPTNPIEVRYEHVGLEPNPGSIYYITANIVRPLELYNTPLYAQNFDQASDLLGPSSTDNDLMIAAQIGLEDNRAPGMFFVQAYDNDQDGVITNLDIEDAIRATERSSRLTDVIVLNGFGTLSTQLISNERMNDPFERKERALWLGVPMGTAIGDVETPGTITFLSKRTLRTTPDSPASGKRVLIANNEATKTIRLTDGTTAVVNLDGSFVAVAVAALNASFGNPVETILRKNISGFDSLSVYSEPEQLQLVAASVVFLSNAGSDTSPVFRIEESVTTDTSAADVNEISVAINQVEYTTRTIRNHMDVALIGFVPRSEQAGVQAVKAPLVQKLAELVSRGFVGPYTDDAGNERTIDPQTDVEVFRDTSQKSTYYFRYWWNGRYGIKRLFGLYSVDQRFFGRQA